MKAPVYSRATELMEAEVGHELVALDVEQGKCFGFNAVATTVWRLLGEPRTAEQVCAALEQEFDVSPDECRRDVDTLLSELVSRGLVRAG